jgi:hypothetical protein
VYIWGEIGRCHFGEKKKKGKRQKEENVKEKEGQTTYSEKGKLKLNSSKRGNNKARKGVLRTKFWCIPGGGKISAGGGPQAWFSDRSNYLR